MFTTYESPGVRVPHAGPEGRAHWRSLELSATSSWYIAYFREKDPPASPNDESRVLFCASLIDLFRTRLAGWELVGAQLVMVSRCGPRYLSIYEIDRVLAETEPYEGGGVTYLLEMAGGEYLAVPLGVSQLTNEQGTKVLFDFVTTEPKPFLDPNISPAVAAIGD